jgi:hypothetical protein
MEADLSRHIYIHYSWMWRIALSRYGNRSGWGVRGLIQLWKGGHRFILSDTMGRLHVFDGGRATRGTNTELSDVWMRFARLKSSVYRKFDAMRMYTCKFDRHGQL